MLSRNRYSQYTSTSIMTSNGVVLKGNVETTFSRQLLECSWMPSSVQQVIQDRGNYRIDSSNLVLKVRSYVGVVTSTFTCGVCGVEVEVEVGGGAGGCWGGGGGAGIVGVDGICCAVRLKIADGVSICVRFLFSVLGFTE